MASAKRDGVRQMVSREVWWDHPPRPGETESDVKWGFLTVYSDGSVEFSLDERPTESEIKNRKGCRLF